MNRRTSLLFFLLAAFAWLAPVQAALPSLQESLYPSVALEATATESTTWELVDLQPCGITEDGTPLALFVFVELPGTFDMFAPVSTRAGPETHTRVLYVVQPVLGLEPKNFDVDFRFNNGIPEVLMVTKDVPWWKASANLQNWTMVPGTTPTWQAATYHEYNYWMLRRSGRTGLANLESLKGQHVLTEEAYYSALTQFGTASVVVGTGIYALPYLYSAISTEVASLAATTSVLGRGLAGKDWSSSRDASMVLLNRGSQYFQVIGNEILDEVTGGSLFPSFGSARSKVGAVELPSFRVSKGTVRNFDVVSYRPSNTPFENHHGLMDIWAKHNVPGYISRGVKTPTVALTGAQHSATKRIYRDWLEAVTGKRVGGKVNWQDVSPREMQKLAEDMFDAANVPAAARAEYYRALNQYIYQTGQ